MILAIDPSLAGTGWAIMHDSKVRKADWIPTKKITTLGGKKATVGISDVWRCYAIATKLLELLIEDDIRIVAVEVPMGAQSANAAKAFGMVKGVVASVCAARHLQSMVCMTPFEVKKRICGDIHAEKELIVAQVEKRCPNVKKVEGRLTRTGKPTPKYFAICDAVAIGLTYYMTKGTI